MKNTRRFIAGFSAMAMAAAMAMSASAVDPTQIVPNADGNPTPETAGAEVTYNVEAAYIVTIPAGADISGGSDEQSITANDVLLEKGQKITVTLFKASNTESGKSFSAKDESGESTVKYTIKAGDTDVAVGNKVAEFETKTGEQSATLTFTKDADSTPTFAGKHTETLTFNIAVESAKAAAEKPDVAQADCTFSPSNGTSTLSNANITTAMEYSADNGTTWTDVTSDGSIASLAAGTLQIRVKESADKLASEAVSITVPEVLHFELVGPYTGDRLTCEYYAGETWQALVNRYDLIKAYSGHPAFGSDGFIYDEKGKWFAVTDLIDNTKTYEVQ